MKKVILFILIQFICLTALVVQVYAQHSIEIQRHAAKGEYYKALVEYEKLPKRRATSAAVTAAARSAWGLGLPERAIQEYETALQDENLTSLDRGRIYFSRAIIELQENRLQTAVLYAERSANLIKEPGPFKSKVLLAWGHSLAEMGLYAAAEEKFLEALADAELEDKPELYFQIAKSQMRLGKSEIARDNLEKIPLRNEHTPQAMRFLAQLALDSKNYEEAEFWLTRGRSEYPESFLDSWVDYVLIRSAIHSGQEKEVSSILEDAKKKYPPSDDWLGLLIAAAEAYLWGEEVD